MEISSAQLRKAAILLLGDSHGITQSAKNGLVRLLDPIDHQDIIQAIKYRDGRCFLDHEDAERLLEATFGDGGLQLIIDTESYAGNFERAMGAFMTGEVGECSLVGETEQAMFRTCVRGEPFKNAIVEDKDGQLYQIVPTPGWFNNGFGAIFKDGQEAEAQAVFEKQRLCVEHNPVFSKQPAFLSVSMTFKRQPTSEQMKLLIERAYKFAAAPIMDRCGHQHPPITITCIRTVPA